jgi:hypothetical protein
MMWASRDHAPTTSGPTRQELWCELCDAEAGADDWITALHALICPACLEAALDTQAMEQQP